MKMLVFVLLLLGSASPALAADAVVVKVIDGTQFQMSDGVIVKIKGTSLLPDPSRQKASHTALSLWLLDRSVRLEETTGGEWGEALTAKVIWRGIDIGEQLVRKGYLARQGDVIQQQTITVPQAAPPIQRLAPPVQYYQPQQQPTWIYQGSGLSYPQSFGAGAVCVGNT